MLLLGDFNQVHDNLTEESVECEFVLTWTRYNMKKSRQKRPLGICAELSD